MVPNEGDRVIRGESDEGLALAMRYSVADISVPLDSISQICDSGAVVLFTKTGGYIVNSNGARLNFTRKGNTYRRKTWSRTLPKKKSTETVAARQDTVDQNDKMDLSWAERLFPRQQRLA